MLLWHYFVQKNVCNMFLCSKNSYLYIMNNPLRRLGNIPVTVSALESLFPHIKRGKEIIARNSYCGDAEEQDYVEALALQKVAHSFQEWFFHAV